MVFLPFIQFATLPRRPDAFRLSIVGQDGEGCQRKQDKVTR